MGGATKLLEQSLPPYFSICSSPIVVVGGGGDYIPFADQMMFLLAVFTKGERWQNYTEICCSDLLLFNQPVPEAHSSPVCMHQMRLNGSIYLFTTHVNCFERLKSLKSSIHHM